MNGFIITFILLLSSFAFGKSQILRWKPLEGAVRYGLHISKNQKTFLKKILKSDSTSWKGNLEPGIYLYRLRAHDKVGRPGNWTAPHVLTVAPPSPKRVFPKDKAKFSKVRNETVVLKWQRVKGIEEYRLLVTQNGESIFDGSVKGNQYTLNEAQYGEYTWQVQALVRATGRLPPSVKNAEVLSEPTSGWDFTVEGVKLSTPQIVYPLEELSTEDTAGKAELRWTPVPGAEGYEVKVLEILPRELATKRRKVRTYFVKKNALDIDAIDKGKYKWGVRAIADIKGKKIGIRGPSSRSEFVVDNPVPLNSFWNFEFLAEPFFYNYTLRTSSASFTPNGSPLGSRYQIKTDYWYHQNGGFGLDVGSAFYRGGGVDFLRNEFSFHARLRFELNDTPGDFQVIADAGIGTRDLFELAGSSLTQFGVFGALASLRVYKGIIRDVQLMGQIGIFMPLSLIAASGTLDSPGTHSDLGLRAYWWFAREWAASLGVSFSNRPFAYTRNGEDVDIDYNANVISAGLRWEIGR